MISYDEKHGERIHPALVEQLKNRQTSLGRHPAFPEEDEQFFEEKLASERFKELVVNYKRQFDVDEIDKGEMMDNTMDHLRECINLQKGHEKELIELAQRIVREEFDVPEHLVEFESEITTEIDTSELEKNDKPQPVEFEFESHEQLQQAKKEVYKRRLINAMIQGSAKKCSHMFHMVEDEINDINPRLNSNYSKMLAGADLTYWMFNVKSDNGTPGGIVQCDFAKNENESTKVVAKSFVFPILVHELVKGVMEVLSAHGLPKDKEMAEYVIAKADFTAAEPWDMRLGPKIWERFTDCMDADDFDIKHHVYTQLVALPVDEFNQTMREIMAGTKAGKNKVQELSKTIKEEIRKDDLNSSLLNDDFGDDDYFNPDEFDDLDSNGLFD